MEAKQLCITKESGNDIPDEACVQNENFWQRLLKHFRSYLLPESYEDMYQKMKDYMFAKFGHQYVVETCDEKDTEELCKTNPGHKDFIPIAQFQINHLPLKYQKEEFFKAIQAVGNLTVVVKNRATGRLGSGKVTSVKEDESDSRCPCVMCKSSKQGSEKWWRVIVLTETSLLLNKTEAKKTICRLFYDNHDSEFVTISCVKAVVFSDCPTNCHLTCATCDEQLVHRLDTELKSCSMWHRKCFVYPMDFESGEKIAVLVSHPHGGPKKVSIGELKEEVTLGEGYKTTNHTVPTCPGCTGAYLYTMRPFVSK